MNTKNNTPQNNTHHPTLRTAKTADFFPTITLADFKLRNFPQQLAHGLYAHAETDFVAAVSGCPDVVSIYTVGEVSAPGFSDLDFIVVVKDAPLHIADFEQRTRAVIARHSDIIIHYPHVLPESLFSSLPYLFPFFSLNCVSGKKIPVGRVQPADAKLLTLIILHDYIDIHWPQEFLRLFLHRQRVQRGGFWSHAVNEAVRAFNVRLGGNLDLPVRVTLCRLNSLKYPLRMLSLLAGKKYPAQESYVHAIQSLRLRWFALPEKIRYETLLRLLKKSIPFSLWLIAETSALLQKYVAMSTFSAPDTFYLNKDHATAYVNRWQPAFSVSASITLYQKTSEIVSFLPKSFLAQKKIMMDVLHGGSADAVQRSFSSLNPHYLRLVLRRALLFKQQVDFLNKNKLSFKPIMRYDVLRPRGAARPYKKISYRFRFRRLQRRL